MSDLLPCPFCGAKAYTQKRDVNGNLFPPDKQPLVTTWAACCENDANCGAEVRKFWHEDDAIKAWNRRD